MKMSPQNLLMIAVVVLAVNAIQKRVPALNF